MNLGGVALEGLSLEPVHAGSTDMIGMTEMFSSHRRVADNAASLYSSHVGISRYYQDMFELPGLDGVLYDAPGK